MPTSSEPHFSPAREALRRFRGNGLAMLGYWGLLAVGAFALLGKFLTEWWIVFDPARVRLEHKLLPPLSMRGEFFLLGTDELGRSLFARLLQGASVSLGIGLVAMAISISVGILMGGIAGYYGQRKLAYIAIDSWVMRLTDVALCFPSFFLILTVIALLPSSIFHVMVVIGLTHWMGTARLVRAEFLALRELDFVTSARALGFSDRRIIFRHILPNALAPVFVTANIDVARAILTESALSFLGFGVDPPHATWGNILADGRAYILDAPWLFLIPGLAILGIVLAFNLVGEGLREAFHTKAR
ncbi:MAG TPA: ABC transporter permease [Polyangiaceae bacterium]|nr:ABC transporter permease [Polyangiaceae bacterium]